MGGAGGGAAGAAKKSARPGAVVEESEGAAKGAGGGERWELARCTARCVVVVVRSSGRVVAGWRGRGRGGMQRPPAGARAARYNISSDQRSCIEYHRLVQDLCSYITCPARITIALRHWAREALRRPAGKCKTEAPAVVVIGECQRTVAPRYVVPAPHRPRAVQAPHERLDGRHVSKKYLSGAPDRTWPRRLGLRPRLSSPPRPGRHDGWQPSRQARAATTWKRPPRA